MTLGGPRGCQLTKRRLMLQSCQMKSAIASLGWVALRYIYYILYTVYVCALPHHCCIYASNELCIFHRKQRWPGLIRMRYPMSNSTSVLSPSRTCHSSLRPPTKRVWQNKAVHVAFAINCPQRNRQEDKPKVRAVQSSLSSTTPTQCTAQMAGPRGGLCMSARRAQPTSSQYNQRLRSRF